MNFYDASILDRHAYLDSVVHRLDPRAKVLAVLFFIVTATSFPKYAVAPLVPFCFLPLAMIILGFIPPGLILKRLLLASPFIVFIGAFNPILDRAVRFEIGGIEVSGGWLSFASILLRGFLCVAAALCLIATTSMPRVTEALARMRVPRVLVVQLMLLYRYLFILGAEALRLNQARTLRGGGGKAGLSSATGMLSTLLIRSLDRSESIYRAMQLRGFDGRLSTPRRMNWRAADSVFVAAVMAGCLAFRLLPVTAFLGARALQ